MKCRINLIISLLFVCACRALLAAEPAWTYEAGGPVAATPLAIDGQILVAGGEKLAALEADGSVAWTIALDGEILSTPVVANDHIYVHTSEGLTVLTADREIAWEYAVQDKGALVDGRTWGWGEALFSDPWAYYRSTPLVTPTAIIVAGSDGVHALDPGTGEVLWQKPTGPVTAGLVGNDDNVLVADWSNHLRSFSVADGSLNWSFRAYEMDAPGPTWIGWMGLNLTPAIAEGQVLLGSRASYFYAVNLESGKVSWSNKHGTSWIGSAAVIHDKQAYFGLSDGKAVIGIDIPSGNQSLFVPSNGPVFATPVIADQYLLAGTLQGELLVIDLEKGRLQATHRLHDNQHPYSHYFQPDPETELSTYEFTVQQMNVMKAEQRSILAMAAISDLLVLGLGDGSVVAFSLEALLSSGE